ncbi:MAG: hypothetical protein GX799_04515 [Crenarchaeota archaeon]|nr:hypothetical protein [Thermoproteota archaeon]
MKNKNGKKSFVNYSNHISSAPRTANAVSYTQRIHVDTTQTNSPCPSNTPPTTTPTPDPTNQKKTNTSTPPQPQTPNNHTNNSYKYV